MGGVSKADPNRFYVATTSQYYDNNIVTNPHRTIKGGEGVQCITEVDSSTVDRKNSEKMVNLQHGDRLLTDILK